MPASETTVSFTGRIPRMLLVAAASLFFLSAGIGPAGAALASGERVTVYYFHSTIRCETCLLIEGLADATLRAEFSDELSSGTLVWRPLDVRLPENSLLVEEFGLRASDLVVVREKSGGQQSREEIPGLWELAADPERLSRHLKDVVVRLLGNRN